MLEVRCNGASVPHTGQDDDVACRRAGDGIGSRAGARPERLGACHSQGEEEEEEGGDAPPPEECDMWPHALLLKHTTVCHGVGGNCACNIRGIRGGSDGQRSVDRCAWQAPCPQLFKRSTAVVAYLLSDAGLWCCCVLTQRPAH